MNQWRSKRNPEHINDPKKYDLNLKAWAIDQFGLDVAAVLCVLKRLTLYCQSRQLNKWDGDYGFVNRQDQYEQTFWWSTVMSVRRIVGLLEHHGLVEVRTRRGKPTWLRVNLVEYERQEQEWFKKDSQKAVQQNLASLLGGSSIVQNERKSSFKMNESRGGSQYNKVLQEEITREKKEDINPDEGCFASPSSAPSEKNTLFSFGHLEPETKQPEQPKPKTGSLRGKRSVSKPKPEINSSDVSKAAVENKEAELVKTSENVLTSQEVPKKASEGLTMTTRIFHSYSNAYFTKYGVRPPQNAKQMAHCKQLLMRLGQDAVEAIAFYVSIPKKDYVEFCHPLSLAVKYCESIHTQWSTNRIVTHSAAAIEDRDGHNRQVIVDASSRHREKFLQSRARMQQKG